MVRGPIVTQRGAGFFFPPVSGPFFPNRFGQPFFFHGAFGQPFFFGNRFRFRQHHHLFFSSFGWPYGFGGYSSGYYPYYPYYPPLMGSYEPPANEYNQQNYPVQYQLQQEVSRLSDEVERLREEDLESRSAPPAPVAPAQPEASSKAAPPPPTTLVFRDGKIQEVQNYAIVGNTLWIFNERQARKVPLAELDIPATKKSNEERDVPFQMPLAR